MADPVYESLLKHIEKSVNEQEEVGEEISEQRYQVHCKTCGKDWVEEGPAEEAICPNCGETDQDKFEIDAVKESKVDEQANVPPPDDSNWRRFADNFDVGVLDLDNFADCMDFRDFADLDISISPERLYNRNREKFVQALRASSLKASDMSDEEIEHQISPPYEEENEAKVDEQEIAEKAVKDMSDEELEKIFSHLEKVSRVGFNVDAKINEIETEINKREKDKKESKVNEQATELKCPKCGEEFEVYGEEEAKCPECGYVIPRMEESKVDEEEDRIEEETPWQAQLDKALEVEEFYIMKPIFSDKRAEGKRYKFRIRKQEPTEMKPLTEEEKGRIDKIVKSVVPDAKSFEPGGLYSRGKGLVTYSLFVKESKND